MEYNWILYLEVTKDYIDFLNEHGGTRTVESYFSKSQTQVRSVIKDLDKSFAMVVFQVSIKSHRSDIVKHYGSAPSQF